MVTHINSVVAPSTALFRCFMYEIKIIIIRVNMISIVFLLPFFQHVYFMHSIYNVVVVVVEIHFNSIQSSQLTCACDIGVSVPVIAAVYKQVKVSSYIAQYPILRIAQSALHITSLANLFNQTPSQLIWEASSHMLQLMREGCSYTYPPLVYSQVLIYTAEWTGAM